MWALVCLGVSPKKKRDVILLSSHETSPSYLSMAWRFDKQLWTCLYTQLKCCLLFVSHNLNNVPFHFLNVTSSTLPSLISWKYWEQLFPSRSQLLLFFCFFFVLLRHGRFKDSALISLTYLRKSKKKKSLFQMISRVRGRAKEWPAVCSGVSQQQQVFTLGEDEGEAAIPASPWRQLGQIQDLLAFHDRLAAALQQHQLVRGRWGIVAHKQAALWCQEQKPLLPLFENKSTCG